MKLNPALRDFWQTKADIKVLKGGRSSSKTYDAAGMAAYLASNYRIKFLCLRKFQNRIEDSVKSTIEEQIEAMDAADYFIITNNSITHKKTGSSFHFYGIARNLREIKGFQGCDICWIEEGEGLTKEEWRTIEPTIRKEGSEIWLIYNPNYVSDFVETFKPGDRTIVRHINYDENPFLSDKMIRTINDLKESDYEDYEHDYLGIAKSDNEKAIIKLSWVEAAIDAHKKLGIDISGQHRVGYDVADSGKDANATISTHGILAYDADKWQAEEDELLKSCTRTYNTAVTQGAHIVYDSIGVGAGCGAKFKDLNIERFGQGKHEDTFHIKYQPFNAGSTKIEKPDNLYGNTQVKNKDHFSNIKAQRWWEIADRLKETYNAVVKGEPYNPDNIISISSDLPYLDELKIELSTPWRDYDKAGRVKVESKEDLAAREVDSPNLADAFIMAYINSQENQNRMVFGTRHKHRRRR